MGAEYRSNCPQVQSSGHALFASNSGHRQRRNLQAWVVTRHCTMRIELAERGYVCLVPDYPSFGEYPYDFKKQGSHYPVAQ